MARVNIDLGSVTSFVLDEARTEVQTVTRQVLNRASVACPVDTGRLRASGRMRFTTSGNQARGTVEYPVHYAAAVHDGTGPRIIRARRKKVLAFRVGGRRVYATRVRHPGTPAQPWLVNSAKEVARARGLTFTPRSV